MLGAIERDEIVEATNEEKEEEDVDDSKTELDFGCAPKSDEDEEQGTVLPLPRWPDAVKLAWECSAMARQC